MAEGTGQAISQQDWGRSDVAYWEPVLLRSLMATMPDALIVTDESGTILGASQMALTMSDYSEEELLGCNAKIIIPCPVEEGGDQYIRFLESQVQKFGTKQRVLAIRKGGDAFPAEISVGEATINGRRLFLAFIHDISIRTEQERRLQDLRNEVAHAERISSMGMLASAIAHELNQPLAAIRNYADTIAALVADEAPIDRDLLRTAMDACAGEASRAGEVIRRLRQFIANGETEQAAESLARLVREALSFADSELDEVEVSVELDGSADEVLVDGVQIEQVVFNIVRNALQAMAGRSQRQLLIYSMGGDEMVEVVVEDSGSGLTAQEDDQLFLPFSTSKSDGLGIGLSICRTIIEGHGGSIWPTPSRLGGAAFHFTIPRMRSERSLAS